MGDLKWQADGLRGKRVQVGRRHKKLSSVVGKLQKIDTLKVTILTDDGTEKDVPFADISDITQSRP